MTVRAAGVESSPPAGRRRATPRRRLVLGVGQRLVEHERLAQREVEVARARAPPTRGLVGAERERAHQRRRSGARGVRADSKTT
jgi:hypothetical protein